MGNGIGSELCPERGEVLQQECRQISIFTKREQILLVERVDIAFSVVIDNSVRDDDGTPLISSTDTIQGETAWKTGHRSKQTFESLR